MRILISRRRRDIKMQHTIDEAFYEVLSMSYVDNNQIFYHLVSEIFDLELVL